MLFEISDKGDDDDDGHSGSDDEVSGYAAGRVYRRSLFCFVAQKKCP